MRFKRQLQRPIAALLVALIVVAVVASSTNLTRAEQNGSSPESGATSRIKTLYDQLVALGTNYGTDSDSPDWGAYWNRIKTAAKWAPNGNAAAGDVVSGKTFFNTTRTSVTGTYSTTNLTAGNVLSGVTYGVSQTGTYPNPTGCSTQQYKDGHGAPVTSGTNCTLTWTAHASPVTGDDATGYDPRASLTWSQMLKNNSGTVAFTTVNDSSTSFSWDASAANNVAVGNKTASQLCSDRGNGWRLPSQKDYLQAYIDGAYFNLTSATVSVFWSRTETDPGTGAYYLGDFSDGAINNVTKSFASGHVRCVR